MVERWIIEQIDRWRERRRPKHHTDLAKTAHLQALRAFGRANGVTQRENAWRAVRLVLLVVMLLAAIVVAWRTFTDVSIDDITTMAPRDLLRKIFRR